MWAVLISHLQYLNVINHISKIIQLFSNQIENQVRTHSLADFHLSFVSLPIYVDAF